MTATLIDGKAIAQQVRSEVRAEVQEWTAGGQHPPGLATILVGDDPASAVYVANKQKACVEVGMGGFSHDLPADTSQDEVERLIGEPRRRRPRLGDPAAAAHARITSTARISRR